MQANVMRRMNVFTPILIAALIDNVVFDVTDFFDNFL